MVTTSSDSGGGSLRQAILDAEARPGPDVIAFDSEFFHDPQTVKLESPLPEISGELTIDGYIEKALWIPTGAILSGGGRFPVLRVGKDARLTVRYLTVAQGFSRDGGGLLNSGHLAVHGVTFLDNRAERAGGAIANLDGVVTVVNSTFAGNRAADKGGALANLSGSATITNCTFSENAAERGGAVFSGGRLLLRNSILANSSTGGDCIAEHPVDPASTRNLIEENRGCGEPISTADPHLEKLAYYNGPGRTFPVGAGSPAVNLGDNAAALDENGQPLVWDQRGSGDPRFVAGFTDLGAFEHQRHPYLVVDTLEDTPLRACTEPGPQDCPLRGAIEIANARPGPDVITFDPKVFAEPQTLQTTRPLPEVTSPLTLDASGTGGVTIAVEGERAGPTSSPGTKVQLVEVRLLAGGKSPATP